MPGLDPGVPVRDALTCLARDRSRLYPCTMNIVRRTLDIDADTDARLRTLAAVRIPIEAGRVFRDEAGHRSDLMSATIPK